MRLNELLDWIDIHGQTAFVIGVFLLIASGSVFTFIVKFIRSFRPAPPEVPCRCSCHNDSCSHCEDAPSDDDDGEEA
jgi:hypothetical protein